MIKGITKSKNLWEESYSSVSTALKYVPVYVGNGEFTLSSNCPKGSNDRYPCLFFLAGQATSGAATSTNDVQNGVTRTVTAIDGYVTIAHREYTDVTPEDYQTMLNSGSQPLPYEPYGDIPKDITRIAMKGKNLFDKSTAANGYYINDANGARSYSTNYNTSASDYIDVSGMSSISISDTGARRWAAFYDDNKIFVSGFNGYGVRTIPQDAKYVRFTIQNEAIDSFMVNEGSTLLPYEPYGMQPGWEVRDQQGNILWGADKTLTGTDSIQFKGYGLPLTDYKVEADMTVPATQEYSIEGTSSIDYQSDGTALTDLEFQGNMVQSGTPSSSSPIYPSEMGERTGNLFDNDTAYSEFKTSSGFSGTASQISPVATTCFTSSDIGKTFTASCKISNVQTVTNVRIKANVNGSNLSGTMINTSGTSVLTFTVETVNDSISITYSSGGSGTYDFEGIMLVEDSEPAPYEPYGYKIPFSNGQTSYNVYLTEPLRGDGSYVDIANSSDGVVTRQFHCYVCKGTDDEQWAESGTGDAKRFYNTVPSAYAAGSRFSPVVICSHFSKGDPTQRNGGCDVYNRNIRVNSVSAGLTDLTDFKAWLAAQYAAGTPVTFWYIINTPITEPVTFPTITPTQGANTLSVSTTLAPSKTRLTATSGVWPKNPIWPAEFGEPTVNLLDFTTVQNSTNASATVNSDGVTISGKYFVKFASVQFTIGQTYSMSWNATTISGNPDLYWRLHYTDDTYSNSKRSGASETVEKEVSELLLYVNMTSAESASAKLTNIMLNLGSTPLPYEPYGKFKIPITCGGNTYNVFTTAPLRKIGSYADYEQLSVGEGRKVKKVVLTGEENWYINDGVSTEDTAYFYTTAITQNTYVEGYAVCTHFEYKDAYHVQTENGFQLLAGYGGLRFRLMRSIAGTVNAFKQWLADEYSAGHPVEVWYVLATEQTTPTQLPTITPTDGNDAFAVNTTVPPSAVTIKGHIKALT